MLLRTWRFLTLSLAALGLTLGAAHVLELGPKMEYDPEMYAAVTSTLYQMYGRVGGAIQVAASVTAVVLVFLVRGRPAFRLTLFGAIGLALSLALWGALVAPVNAEWLRVTESTPESVPEAYMQLRHRWEYGHVAAFTAWLAGFFLLLSGALSEIPAPAPPEPHS